MRLARVGVVVTSTLVLVFAVSVSSQAAGTGGASADGIAGRRLPRGATESPHLSSASRAPRLTEDQRARDRWFLRQRAFPHRTIPAGAFLSARAHAEGLAVTEPGSGSASDWAELGPRPISTRNILDIFGGTMPLSGRVEALATDPTNSLVAYAAAEEGGLWKTTDGGVTWAPLFDTQPTMAMGSVAVDPRVPSTIYTGTGAPGFAGNSYYGAGLFKSTNGGTTWTKMGGTLFDDCSMPDVLVNPSNSNIVLVAVKAPSIQGKTDCSSRAGVYRSADGGTSWTKVLSGFATDLAVDKLNSQVWYAGITLSGGWKSIDGGVTWTQLSGGLPTGSLVGRVMIAVAPSSSSRLYAFMENFWTNDALGIFTSADSGVTWTPISVPADICGVPGEHGQCFHAMALAIDPRTSTTFYAGGVLLYRFMTSGSTNARIGAGPPGVHVDFHALAFDALRRLWIGNDGGVYRTSDQGATFSNLNAGLGITQFYPGTAGNLSAAFIGGTQDNGTIEDSGTPAWTLIDGGDGGYTGVDPANADVMYSTHPGELTISKSIDGGLTFEDASSGIDPDDPSEFVYPVVMDPANSSRLLAGTNRVWQTVDGAQSWTDISPRFSATISALAPAPSNASTIYAGLSDGRVRATVNGGANWRGVSFGLPSRYVTDLLVNPANSSEAYLTVSGFGSGHVFHTTTLGVPWTNISGNLPDAPMNAIAVDWRTNPATLYTGGDVGVFTSTDGGTTWTHVGTTLPNTIVMDLLIDLGTNRLVASTYGRGSWSLPLGGEPSVDLSISQIAQPPSVTTGQNVTYSITVTNQGPSSAPQVIMADNLPRLSSFVSASPSVGSCTSTRIVVCSLGALANGQSATVTVVAQAIAGGSLANTARVSGPVSDPDGTDNLVTATTSATLGAACTITGTTGDDFLVGTPGDDRICALDGDDVVAGMAGNDVLDGSSGFDWVLYQFASGGVTVNLATGVASGGDGADTLTNMEAVIGSFGNDSLTGNTGGNYFQGMPGNDTITGGGGAGFDYAVYVDSFTAVTVNLVTGKTTGGDDVDTLKQIGGLYGSDFDDALTGNTAQNEFWGEGGADTITGGGCSACLDFSAYADASTAVQVNLATGTVTGGAGNDHLVQIGGILASLFDDTLTGDGLANSFYGLDGNDAMDGGGGTDIVIFDFAASPVTVNLTTGSAVGEGTDSLVSLEQVSGSDFGDNITGSSAANYLLGNFGADTLDVRDGIGGNDTIDGGPDPDTCLADPGDFLIGCP